ncbi:MAG: invasin domain 3-containing protein, partial [Serratia sp. (in: enterobacteria)]|uniref:invasin domain 3-containing protein n=1 Tax=Serratia sp. (in: enterobacteria) TaxID=616 RepID=UPI003F37D7C1
KVTVTYTAKDANGNPVSELTNLGLLVDGITGYTFVAFADQGNGIYTGTLTGTQAGTATLMPLWSGTRAAHAAASLILTAGPMAPANSTVAISLSSIVADGTTTTKVTYTAKDSNNNVVSGLTGLTLPVTSVTNTSFTGFVESGTTGIYTGSLSGKTAGTATLMPQWNGGSAAKTAVTLTLTQWVSAITSVTANGYTFTGSTFPRMAFSQAAFTLNPPVGSVSDFNWASDNSNITVSTAAKVTVGGTGINVRDKVVTITGTPKVLGKYPTLTRQIQFTKWVHTLSRARNYADAKEVCVNFYGGGALMSASVYGSVSDLISRGSLTRLIGSWGLPTETAYPGNSIVYATDTAGTSRMRTSVATTVKLAFTGMTATVTADELYPALCINE